MISRIVKSLSFEPYLNLALEEYLLEHLTEDETILYLWQNDNTVVIGRHQNAWLECRNFDLRREGGTLVRRLSGGGAVFHDLGNLNFTFLMNKKYYDLKKQLSVISRALKRLGIDVELSERNDLLIGERKFSGSAYFLHKDNALHHGTILINSNLEKLSRYLKASPEAIIAKGIDSVRSRVVNLVEISPLITLDKVIKSVEESFREIYGGDGQETTVKLRDYPLDSLVEKYSSWEWRFGHTPSFELCLNKRFNWGRVEMKFEIKRGCITTVKVFSEALSENLIRDIGKYLEGCFFRKDSMIEGLEKIESQAEDQQVLNDVTQWILSKVEGLGT